MKRYGVLVSTLLALSVAACASTGASSGDGSPRRSSSRSVITADDLQDIVVSNVYDAVQRLRPSWLRPRGGSGLPAVFRDDIKVGDDTESLRIMNLDNVREIRFINARDATTRWGTGFRGGAIQIITRR